MKLIMEDNATAVECLILFYINTKHVLKTKQLDERVFLDQMIKHCKENGFDSYSSDEIRSTWKNITQKYLELKKTGGSDERESWKYYEILDSCYEQSDFHNGVYPKFSEEMVWYLLECFIKRRGLERTQKRNTVLNDIHKSFLHNGYLYITKQDIENKWKYLNFKYDKLKSDPESLSKLPYLQAIKGFRDGSLVKIIFTKALTEILIERFTDKKITCVIHGYDSEQVLNEIQAEFRELGFDFDTDEIREKWKKLTNIYSFIVAKGKHDSPWIHFNAMKDHFKDDFLFNIGNFTREMRDERREKSKLTLRQRSKSVGPDIGNKRKDMAKLVVNIEQLDKEKLSPSPKKTAADKKVWTTKRKSSSNKSMEELPKRLKTRSKSRESERMRDCKSRENELEKRGTPKEKRGSENARKSLRKLSIDRSINQELTSGTDLGSPGSKLHIINIDHTEIDKNSGNLTINLPSITKQFSDNEFLPLKKRLRLAGDNTDKNSDESKDMKEGFRGFPSKDGDIKRKRTKSESDESKRLTDEEMSEIMQRIAQEKLDLPEGFSKDANHLKSGTFDYKNQDYSNTNLLMHKEQNGSAENHEANAVTQSPVLLLVIKVDGSKKQNTTQEENKSIEKTETPEKNVKSSCSINIVKPISPKEKPSVKTSLQNIKGGNIVTIKNTVINTSEIDIKNNGLIKVSKPKDNNCTITLNDKKSIPEDASHKIHVNIANTDVPVQNLASIDNNNVPETVPIAASETVVYSTPQDPSTKKVRLPVKGGGLLKEIFISQRELKKLAKIRPGDYKPTTSPIKKPLDSPVKDTTQTVPLNKNKPITQVLLSNISPVKKDVPQGVTPPKIKFISQIIRPANAVIKKEADLDVNNPTEPENHTLMPPPPSITTAAKFTGTNNSNGDRDLKNDDFDTESVLSEAVGEEECVKDKLLATVIDFQEQNNQEFVEIKNLMKQNNLLQRETNRLLRLLLEKL